MPRRRTIFKVIAARGGATLNVAVAWGLAVVIPDGVLRDEVEDVYRVRWHSNKEEEVLVYAAQGRGWISYYDCMGVNGRLPSMPEPEPWVKNNFAAHPDKCSLVQAWGWPWLSLHCAWIENDATGEQTVEGEVAMPFRPLASNMPFQAVPWRPLWPGFAVNTLFYAGVLWMLFCGPFSLRRMTRRRRGRCAACAYPIGQSPVCTECGAPHTVNVVASQGAGRGNDGR